jgi:hypothetical protein
MLSGTAPYFLTRVRGLDFNNQNDIDFLSWVIDNLFADAGGYKGLDEVILFSERCFLFDAFFTGPHLQERNHRDDLFYLYYMIYSCWGTHRDELTTQHLQELTQSFRQLNYGRTVKHNNGLIIKDIFPEGSLEDIFVKAAYIYSECNTGEEEYYELNIDDFGPLVHLLYAHQLSITNVELISNVLSVLPACFNAPLHTTIGHLINRLPRIRMKEGDFNYITISFTNRLLLNSQIPHLNILSELL